MPNIDLNALPLWLLIGLVAIILSLLSYAVLTGRNVNFWGFKIDGKSDIKEKPATTKEEKTKTPSQNTSSKLQDFVEEPKQLVSLGSSEVTFDKISKVISSAPPLPQKEIARKYEGVKVDWVTYLFSASKNTYSIVNLTLLADEPSFLKTIFCKVSLDDYRELMILERNTCIKVVGVISEASTYEVTLNDVTLELNYKLPQRVGQE